MSTRMMLVIQENKELKVASYGHYDGYPTSAGMDIFKTLKSIDIDDFKIKIKRCSFYSQEEADIFKQELNKRISELRHSDFLSDGHANLLFRNKAPYLRKLKYKK